MADQDKPPMVLTVKQVAAELQLTPIQVYNLIKAGKIPSLRPSERNIRVPRTWLEEWVRKSAGLDSAS